MLINFKNHLILFAVALAASFSVSSVFAACENDESPADQSIVLAIDISFSVDKEEMQHQMNGYGSALLDQTASNSFLSCGCTEVTVVFWGAKPVVALDTKKIKDMADLLLIKKFFNEVSQKSIKNIQDEYMSGYITNVGQALQKSASLLLNPRNTAFRKTIIISGDGPHNSNLFPKEKITSLKDLLMYEGVNVYAVPIVVSEETKNGRIKALDKKLGREPRSYYSDEEIQKQLDVTPDFYRDYVITRADYIHVSNSFADMGRAMTKTLTSMQCLMM